jgi:acetyl esterase/lipase
MFTSFLAEAAIADPGPAFPVYPPGTLQKGPTPERVQKTPTGTDVWNVSEPSLTPYLPAVGKANGTAVIVAPGGGFWFLSWENEGTRVAERLAQEGYTAFVLRYRLDPMPDDLAAYQAASLKKLQGLLVQAGRGGAQDVVFDGEKAAAADAAEAVRQIRRRAGEWNVDPGKIGFVGFSAGGITAANVATGDATGRPDFVGIIYGALHNQVPPDAPPAFVAASVDDTLMGAGAVPMFQAWRTAGRPVELHLFEKGGHGWGMTPNGTTTDKWFEQFVLWMRMRSPAKIK